MDIIHALFEQYAKQYPLHIAIRYEEQSLSYETLNQKANQLAHFLKDKIQPEMVVALCFERSFDTLIAIMAVLKLGAGYLPLDPKHPPARLDYCLKDSNAALILSHKAVEQCLISLDYQYYCIDSLTDLDCQSNTNLNRPILSSNIAYVIYTSGSTGHPKGVVVEHRNVINFCRWFQSFTGCFAQQRIDFSLNYIFDMAVSNTIIPLMLGLTIVIGSDETKKDPRNYLRHLAKQKIAMVKMTPSYLKILTYEVSQRFIALNSLQTLILGGEALTPKECQDWLKYYPDHRLINEYGPTETTVAVTHFMVDKSNIYQLTKTVPIGRFGLNNYGYILDKLLNPVANLQTGELYIGGLSLARGYLNQPQMTKKRFIKDPFNPGQRLYKTGDLCCRLENGNIEYLGRIDQQVKIRGFRIELAEIEHCMNQFPAILAAVVLAQPKKQETQLIGYYTVKKGHQIPDNQTIKKYLRHYLADYMIPVALVHLEAFPLTANAKLDLKALPNPFENFTLEKDLPKTTLEQKLITLWNDLLETSIISTTDNFFELGGDSLLVACMISSVRSFTYKELNLKDFYANPTIDHLIQMIHTSESVVIASETSVCNSSQIPLSDFQLTLWLADTFEPKAKRLNIATRKRFAGLIEIQALKKAVQQLLLNHPILTYQLSRFKPLQMVTPKNALRGEVTLVHLDSHADETEMILWTSMNELVHFKHWSSRKPLIIFKLFYLKNHTCELQIALPHIISDAHSIGIIFDHLSNLYSTYQQAILPYEFPVSNYFVNNITLEKQQFNHNITEKISFWQNYLKDANFYTFPNQYIVKNKPLFFNYSTYVSIPEDCLARFKQKCLINKTSLHDGLCAVVSLVLYRYNPSINNLCLNIIKSTRDSMESKDNIGCFLRVDPIKVTVNALTDFISLLKAVHQAKVDSVPYQHCSALIKLASINFPKKKNVIFSYLIKWLNLLSSRLFTTINHELLRFCSQLINFDRKNSFLVNINVLDNFDLKNSIANKRLFNLAEQPIINNYQDLLAINYLLDLCFIRNEHDNAPYLVLSANLIPDFRQHLANDVVDLMHKLCVSEKVN